MESLYGQDLDSGHHGSGFPLPPFRQRLLEAHLAAQARVGAFPHAIQSWLHECGAYHKLQCCHCAVSRSQQIEYVVNGLMSRSVLG